jgi:hypothetical protein
VSRAPEHRSYNVTAVYPDMERARRGTEALEEHGIEAGDIFLSGGAAKEAHAGADTAQRDRASLTFFERSAAAGWLVGLVLGAILGLIVGLTVTDDLGGVLASVAGFGIMGAFLGFFVGLISRGKISGPFEETFDDVSGDVVVGVHTHDREAYESAVSALARTDPEKLSRFDGQGNELPSDR